MLTRRKYADNDYNALIIKYNRVELSLDYQNNVTSFSIYVPIKRHNHVYIYEKDVNEIEISLKVFLKYLTIAIDDFGTTRIVKTLTEIKQGIEELL